MMTEVHDRKERTWLSPMTDVTMAEPKPVVTLTLIPPIMLQTMMYQSMLFLPYLDGCIIDGRNECGEKD